MQQRSCCNFGANANGSQWKFGEATLPSGRRSNGYHRPGRFQQEMRLKKWRGDSLPQDLSSQNFEVFSKVPRVTLAFWIVKILATTVGETGGDALSMTLNLGYLVSTMIFLGFFIVTLTAQVISKGFHPLFYWAVVIATTTVGTTTSDYL